MNMLARGFESLRRILVPRNTAFFDLIERQGEVASRAAWMLFDWRGEPGLPSRMHAIEREGDELVDSMEASLAATFVTSIDRDDLHRLSSELDDVLDRCDSAVKACDLRGVAVLSGPMKKLVGCLVRATVELSESLPNLRAARYDELIASGRRIRKIENEADVIYSNAIKALQNVDAAQQRREEKVLDELENAVDCCKRVAGLLSTLAVKHG